MYLLSLWLNFLFWELFGFSLRLFAAFRFLAFWLVILTRILFLVRVLGLRHEILVTFGSDIFFKFLLYSSKLEHDERVIVLLRKIEFINLLLGNIINFSCSLHLFLNIIDQVVGYRCHSWGCWRVEIPHLMFYLDSRMRIYVFVLFVGLNFLFLSLYRFQLFFLLGRVVGRTERLALLLKLDNLLSWGWRSGILVARRWRRGIVSHRWSVHTVVVIGWGVFRAFIVVGGIPPIMRRLRVVVGVVWVRVHACQLQKLYYQNNT